WHGFGRRADKHDSLRCDGRTKLWKPSGLERGLLRWKPSQVGERFHDSIQPIQIVLLWLSYFSAGWTARFGVPGEIRTHDLFHAMEARSQLRHRPISITRNQYNIGS